MKDDSADPQAPTSLNHNNTDNAVNLEKKVGLAGSVGLIVGIIIGSGIFITPGGVAATSGSVGLSLLLWGIGGVISLIGAICMAELGTLIKISGGEYTYIRLGLADWLGYSWAWTMCILLKPAGGAIVILTCSQYILTPVFDDGCGPPPEFYTKLLGAVIILFLATVNVYSVRLATSIQVIFTVAKVVGLLIIIIGGIVKIAQGNTEILATGFENSNDNSGEIILGFYSAMFAYDGWTNLNAITEEVIDPVKTMPKAMYIAMPLVVILYMLANVSYFSVMTVREMVTSRAVGITWAQRVIPQAPWLIPVCVAMSTFGGLNGALFTIGRLFYSAASRGHMIQFLSYIHVKNITPMPAIILSTTVMILYLLVGEVRSLVRFLIFTVWVYHFLSMLAMIVMRFREPYKSMHRPYKVPLVLPFIVLIFSLVLVVVPLALAPQVEFAYAVLVIVSGFIFYFPFVLCGVKVPCLKVLTCYFQLMIEVVPPTGLEQTEERGEEEHLSKKDA